MTCIALTTKQRLAEQSNHLWFPQESRASDICRHVCGTDPANDGAQPLQEGHFASVEACAQVRGMSQLCASALRVHRQRGALPSYIRQRPQPAGRNAGSHLSVVMVGVMRAATAAPLGAWQAREDGQLRHVQESCGIDRRTPAAVAPLRLVQGNGPQGRVLIAVCARHGGAGVW